MKKCDEFVQSKEVAKKYARKKQLNTYKNVRRKEEKEKAET